MNANQGKLGYSKLLFDFYRLSVAIVFYIMISKNIPLYHDTHCVVISIKKVISLHHENPVSYMTEVFVEDKAFIQYPKIQFF